MTQNNIIYIHFPYCLSKCPYCDFKKDLFKDKSQEENWKKSIIKEIKRYKLSSHIESIFFGGGTPSLLNPKTIEDILSIIPIQNDTEITMEANPNSTHNLIDFKNAGINRISIGIQSLNDKNLQFLGRSHSAKDAYNAIENALSTFERTSFDFIYGLPDQKISDWQDELKVILGFNSKHISMYQLTIEPNTPFGKKYKKELLTDDVSEEFYMTNHRLTSEFGLHAYEVSNYGEKCKHNMGYWKYKNYIGLGPSAHGRVIIDGKKYRTEQIYDIDKWHKSIEENGNGDSVCEEINIDEQKIEKLLVGLRLYEGIEIESDFLNIAKLNDLKNEDFIEYENLDIDKKIHIKPTLKGILCLNSIIKYIIT